MSHKLNKMEIRKLESDIIAKIKSSISINTMTKCITELVLNSLDANSTAVAVRVNFVTFRIQVVDNGDGISRDNLKQIGQRYMTNKCKDLSQLQSQLMYYGFRGESLASIVDISKTVEITSKCKNSTETYSKIFRKATKNDIISEKNRPSCGTTVTIDGFLYNLPLRKKCIIPEVELVYIKRSIECLIIIHPNISFSLRDDVSGDLILNSKKCEDIITSFKSLHPEINVEFSLIKVSKNNITVKGLIFKKMFETNCMQYIYVNKRPVKCTKIQIFISSLLQKNKKHVQGFNLGPLFANEKNKHCAYVININCPCSFVDMLLSPTKVEFQNWTIIFSCIEKLISSFLGITDISIKNIYTNTCKPLKSNGGISQINGMFKGCGFKRKSNFTSKLSPRKIQKSTQKEDNLLKELQYSTENYVETSDQSIQQKNKIKTIIEKNQSRKMHRKSKENINVCKTVYELNELPYKCKENTIDTTNIDEIENESNVTKSVNDELKVIEYLPTRHLSHTSLNPLPITIFNRKKMNLPESHNINFSTLIKKSNIDKTKQNDKNKHKADTSINFNVHKLIDEKSFHSKFTTDENKGKHLIMDMFLKSTQVYNSEDENQNESENTVLEFESKYFLENNITQNINGKSRTMSVSVNIMKKIKRKIHKRRTTSKAIQTSFDKNNMVAKYAQTSMQHRNFSNNTSLSKNCKISLSTAQHNDPSFKFLYQTPFNLSVIQKKIPLSENNCKCNCHTNSNFFNFSNINDSKKINFCDIALSPIKKIDLPNISKTFKLNEIHRKPRNRHFINQNKSPYFLNIRHNIPFTSNIVVDSIYKEKSVHNSNLDTENINEMYNFLKPQFRSTQISPLHTDIKNNRNVSELSVPFSNCSDNFKFNDKMNRNADNIKYFQENCNITLSNIPEIKNECNISLFSNSIKAFENSIQNYCRIDEPYSSSAHNFSRNSNNIQLVDINRKCNILNEIRNVTSSNNYQQTKDIGGRTFHCNPVNVYQANKTTSDHGEFATLFITLSNCQKQELLENEFINEKKLHNKLYLEWDSQIETSKEKTVEDIHPNGCEKDWIKKLNNFGNTFYINRKTGFTTFCTPVTVTNNFKFGKRYEFIPKGLSPILKGLKNMDKSLSQNKKDKLESYILENYQNELHVIKWKNYIKNNENPKLFFEELYKEKLNKVKNNIPSALHCKKYFTNSRCPISFNKALFDNITMIGQVDKKFIAVLEETKHFIILFDQHAVHERIRLEELLKGYSNVPLYEKKVIVFLSYNHLSLLERHEKYLKSIGLYVEFFKKGIKVLEIPLCLYNKFRDNDISLNTAIQLLIKEIIDLIMETGGVAFKTLPKIIQNVINLEACRGAIKFGDKITNEDSEELLKQLSNCNLPFQCAHGRPTLVPLLALNSEKRLLSNILSLKKLLH